MKKKTKVIAMLMAVITAFSLIGDVTTPAFAAEKDATSIVNDVEIEAGDSDYSNISKKATKLKNVNDVIGSKNSFGKYYENNENDNNIISFHAKNSETKDMDREEKNIKVSSDMKSEAYTKEVVSGNNLAFPEIIKGNFNDSGEVVYSLFVGFKDKDNCFSAKAYIDNALIPIELKTQYRQEADGYSAVFYNVDIDVTEGVHHVRVELLNESSKTVSDAEYDIKFEKPIIGEADVNDYSTPDTIVFSELYKFAYSFNDNEIEVMKLVDANGRTVGTSKFAEAIDTSIISSWPLSFTYPIDEIEELGNLIDGNVRLFDIIVGEKLEIGEYYYNAIHADGSSEILDYKLNVTNEPYISDIYLDAFYNSSYSDKLILDVESSGIPSDIAVSMSYNGLNLPVKVENVYRKTDGSISICLEKIGWTNEYDCKDIDVDILDNAGKSFLNKDSYNTINLETLDMELAFLNSAMNSIEIPGSKAVLGESGSTLSGKIKCIIEGNDCSFDLSGSVDDNKVVFILPFDVCKYIDYVYEFSVVNKSGKEVVYIKDESAEDPNKAPDVLNEIYENINNENIYKANEYGYLNISINSDIPVFFNNDNVDLFFEGALKQNIKLILKDALGNKCDEKNIKAESSSVYLGNKKFYSGTCTFKLNNISDGTYYIEAKCGKDNAVCAFMVVGNNSKTLLNMGALKDIEAKTLICPLQCNFEANDKITLNINDIDDNSIISELTGTEVMRNGNIVYYQFNDVDFSKLSDKICILQILVNGNLPVYYNDMPYYYFNQLKCAYIFENQKPRVGFWVDGDLLDTVVGISNVNKDKESKTPVYICLYNPYTLEFVKRIEVNNDTADLVYFGDMIAFNEAMFEKVNSKELYNIDLTDGSNILAQYEMASVASFNKKEAIKCNMLVKDSVNVDDLAFDFMSLTMESSEDWMSADYEFEYKVNGKCVKIKDDILKAKKSGKAELTISAKCENDTKLIGKMEIYVFKPSIKKAVKLTNKGESIELRSLLKNVPNDADVTWLYTIGEDSVCNVSNESVEKLVANKNGKFKVTAVVSLGEKTVTLKTNIKVKMPK